MPLPIWKGFSGLIIQPESGKLSLSDRATFTDVYKGPAATCEGGVLRRGTFGSGDRAGWVVTSSISENEKGGIGKLTINWEAGGASASAGLLPLSEFDSQVVELYPKIERNAFFAGITRDTISAAYAAVLGATKAQRDAAYAYVSGLSDPTQQNLGLKLISKLQMGEESWYLAGMRYMYIWYSFTAPALNMGGYVDSPAFATTFGIASYDWLRLADFVQAAGVNGSAFKVTSTWLGGPGGYWDTDIY